MDNLYWVFLIVGAILTLCVLYVLLRKYVYQGYIPLMSETADRVLFGQNFSMNTRHISGSDFLDVRARYQGLSRGEKRLLSDALRKSPGSGKTLYVQSLNDEELVKLRGAAKKVYGKDGTSDEELSEELRGIETLAYTQIAYRKHQQV